MSAVLEARKLLAQAVTSAGIACTPYPPDTTVPPAAWVEGVDVDYGASGWSFCGAGPATARIVAAAPANDKAGSLQQLEDHAPAVNTALENIPGVRVLGWGSGDTKVDNKTFPAVIWTVQFTLTDQTPEAP